jgi:hypothetical protein
MLTIAELGLLAGGLGFFGGFFLLEFFDVGAELGFEFYGAGLA